MMSQKSSISSTSFIVPSNENLDKSTPLSSSSRSTASSDNMTTSDSMHGSLYHASMSNVNSNLNNMNYTHSQPHYELGTPNSLPPPPPPPLPPAPPPSHSQTGPKAEQAFQRAHASPYLHAVINGNSCNGFSSNNSGSILPSSDTCSNQALSVELTNFPHNQSSQSLAYNTAVDQRSINSSASNERISVVSTTVCSTPNYNNSCSPKSNHSTKSFQQSDKLTNSHSQANIDHYESTGALMPMNVKTMLLNGVASHEVMRCWLNSIKCGEYLKNFVDHGYDMPLLNKMTPQDLTAIGIKSPNLRKKFLQEIRKLNIEDDIPNHRANNLKDWLMQLKLSEYYVGLCHEGYDTIEKVCDLTWEDLEDIGISKLGHQKRLLLGMERVKKWNKEQEEKYNDYAIYDVHPNHKISLSGQTYDGHRLSTLGRSTMRPGFFKTKSGSNLRNRGMPVATVVPALQHVNNSLANLTISHQTMDKTSTTNESSITCNNRLSLNSQPQQPLEGVNDTQPGEGLNDSDFSTIKPPPPLPPIRVDSLKSGGVDQTNDCNSIYGEMYGTIGTYGVFQSMSASSTFSGTNMRRSQLNDGSLNQLDPNQILNNQRSNRLSFLPANTIASTAVSPIYSTNQQT